MSIKILKYEKNSRSNLVENVIIEAMMRVLDELDENMHAKLETRFGILGDDWEYYSPEGKFLNMHNNIKSYYLPLSDCSYDNIYKLLENILKDNLYDRKDSDANFPVVYISDCRVKGSDIEIKISVGLPERND